MPTKKVTKQMYLLKLFPDNKTAEAKSKLSTYTCDIFIYLEKMMTPIYMCDLLDMHLVMEMQQPHNVYETEHKLIQFSCLHLSSATCSNL